jgi:histidinol phosphatase-like enzyme
MKRVLFIDRDGTLIKEYPPTYQIDSWEKLEFYPFAFTYMHKIATELDYELVMVSNQDGLGINFQKRIFCRYISIYLLLLKMKVCISKPFTLIKVQWNKIFLPGSLALEC